MFYLTCTTIISVDLAHYGVSRAKDWVSVDCGTILNKPHSRIYTREKYSFETDFFSSANTVCRKSKMSSSFKKSCIEQKLRMGKVFRCKVFGSRYEFLKAEHIGCAAFQRDSPTIKAKKNFAWEKFSHAKFFAQDKNFWL